MEQETLEIELLQDRVDSMMVAHDELRERLDKATAELDSAMAGNEILKQNNRDLSAQIDRLRVHLAQGVEL